jgi:hypothetical protein
MKNKRKLERIAIPEMAMLEFFCSFLCLLTTVFSIVKPGRVSCYDNETKQKQSDYMSPKNREKKRKGTDYRNSNLCINKTKFVHNFRL